ncbi:MAG: ASKHA domain-containing protein [Oscillospiraceae bacterium]|nr:ASKHA domain-containing protein [Oscillospiraceae bacterium]
MPNITFLPQNITVEAQINAPLLEAARLAGVSVETPCGGKGVCRKCLVRILTGKVDVKSGSYTYRDAKENQVLICQSNVSDEDVTVEILSGLYGEEGKFDDVSDISSNLNKIAVNPIVKQTRLTVPQPAPLDGLSDFDRLKKAVKTNIAEKFSDIKIPLSVLSQLPIKLRKNNGAVKIFYYFDCGVLNIVSITETENTDMYGIAVDVGTTTITLWLVDIITGEIKSRKTDYNAQIECGLDVITRINYAQKNLNELRERVLITINDLIKIAAEENNIDYNKIYCASLAGNTVMIHLLLGICPEYIRLDPYTPAVFRPPLFSAHDIGIVINPDAPVKTAPSVGSYVGGDITVGALCTPLSGGENESELMLFLDVGTNGEILLGNNEFILGCACSAGPAFEGGGIEFGMRASKGAIDSFEICENGEKNEINIRTIDKEPPFGICGSGIITVVGEMFKHKIIDAAGRFTDKMPDRIKKDKKPYKFYITDEITISEADIDNLIRAKGAMFSACRTLLKNMGLTFGDVDKIYIAGGFGKYLNIEDAKAIGLLPNIPEDRIIYLGNTSILGAYQTLLSEENEKKVQEIADRITYIDLSNEAGYMDEYLAALFIPHTDSSLFE